jgi:hypothetical protein
VVDYLADWFGWFIKVGHDADRLLFCGGKVGTVAVRIRPLFSHMVICVVKKGANMSLKNIIQEVRAEISRLQQALALLGAGTASAKRATAAKPRRKMSAAGRRRIAAAQKKRWAKVRTGKK